MAGKNTAVYGICRDRVQAEECVNRLLAAGFRGEDVSVLLPDNQGTKDFAHDKNTKAPEGTTTGVVTGGAVGGALGLLAGIGALAIPGLGPFIAAGPIMGALAGLGVGGTVGGLIGALVGMGIPEYEAKRYEGRIKEGGILLSVHCDSSEWVKRAKALLEESGCNDIASAGEESADFASSDKPLPRTRRAAQREVAPPPVQRMAAGSSQPYAPAGPGEPAYDFGSSYAVDPAYANSSWIDVEPRLRQEWESRPRDRWEDVRDAIRYGWERARQQH